MLPKPKIMIAKETKLIAKMMGWQESACARFYWVDKDAKVIDWNGFAPFDKDADCMMAWDKFTTWFLGNTTLAERENFFISMPSMFFQTGVQRRQAMCEFMAEVTLEKIG